ncbi:MAG: hypothetical protein JXB38_00830, partial [Anaerolineales bacterium]|nr:hypothetical protein [Anaerolineales bacterium]
TLTATITPTETAPPPTSTPNPTATPTPIVSYYDSLPPGDYIIYAFDEIFTHWRVSPENEGIPHYFVSADGENLGVIIDELGGRMTPNGKFIIFARDSYGITRYYRYEIATNTYKEIYIPVYKCWQYIFSPDAIKIAANCENNIHILSVDDLTYENLTPWTEDQESAIFSGLAWSFDGQYIAYGYSPKFMEQVEYGGVYITDVNCLSQPDTCKDKTSGPFLNWRRPADIVIVWAINDRYLAFTNDDSKDIYFTDIENNQEELLIDLENRSPSFAWSPDSTTLAYSQPDGIYIISRENKQPVRILETDQIPLVEAWITIP